MKTYLCYIKSHCEAPDFEMEVEAKNKKEAVNKILGDGYHGIGRWGWEYPEVAEHTREVK